MMVKSRRGYTKVIAKPNGTALRGLRGAIAALFSCAPGPTGEDALAVREQLHRDAQARVQGELKLRGDA
jgi:hypothetical protein